MFLRWHYIIDVVAGLTLALSACLLAARISRREVARRQERGLQPVWAQLLPERAEAPMATPELHSARH
jgi:membrane-associated phospholipid phosphatase